MFKSLLFVSLLTTTALVGCKKKAAEDKAAGSDTTEPAGSGSAAAPAPAPTPTAGSGSAAAADPAPAPAAGTMTADEYKTKGNAMAAEVVALFKETDCEKLGAALNTLLDGNKAERDAVDAYEKAHPDEKKALEAAHEGSMKELSPTLEKCKDNATFKAAMAKMPD